MKKACSAVNPGKGLAAVLSLNQIVYEYNKGKPVLGPVDLHIGKGEYIAIVGGNGSGKSTLAKVMKGLLLPQSGSVVISGADASGTQGADMLRRRVGIVFQNPDDQFITANVTDEIVFGMENLGMAREEMHIRLRHVLRAVRLEAEAEAMPHELSGGQKQRAAIAAVLAMSPDMLILDEATSMLDPEARGHLLRLMKEIHGRGSGIVHITHHMEEALHADRALVLHRGRIAFDGAPAELFGLPDLSAFGLSAPFAFRLRRRMGAEMTDVPLNGNWKEWVTTLWNTQSRG